MVSEAEPISDREIWIQNLPPPETVSEAFFAKVGPITETGCRLWAGIYEQEYGVFKLMGRPTRATHVALWIATGKWPTPGPSTHGRGPELWVLHTCDTPACVHFEHLYAGTPKDNVRDMVTRGRAFLPIAKTELALIHLPDGVALADHNPGVHNTLMNLAIPERFQNAHHAPATHKAYAFATHQFSEWLEERGVFSVPVEDHVIAAYLYWMADVKKRKLSGMELAMMGVLHYHKNHGHEYYRGPLTQKAMIAVRRTLAGTAQAIPDRVAPIRPDDLRKFVSVLKKKSDRTMILLGFYAALRRSEIAALNVGDVTFVPEGLVVQIQKSKTDQTGKGDTIGVWANADEPEICAVQSMKDHLRDLSADSGTPLFSVRGRRLGDNYVARVIKRAAYASGLDGSIYSGHSMRRGFMTTSSEAGFSVGSMMKQSRHKSERVALMYVDRRDLFKGNATEGLTTRSRRP
jgi:integrase